MNREPCEGDQGSPLIWEDESDKYRGYLYGITSFINDKECDNKFQEKTPGVFTHIPHVLKRILEGVYFYI